jgi:hypothetical protein
MAHREEERGTAAGCLGPAAVRHSTTGDDRVFWWTGSDQGRPGGGKGHGEGVRAGQRIPVESVSWCMRPWTPPATRTSSPEAMGGELDAGHAPGGVLSWDLETEAMAESSRTWADPPDHEVA